MYGFEVDINFYFAHQSHNYRATKFGVTTHPHVWRSVAACQIAPKDHSLAEKRNRSFASGLGVSLYRALVRPHRS